jgi:hypothetical protein
MKSSEYLFRRKLSTALSSRSNTSRFIKTALTILAVTGFLAVGLLAQIYQLRIVHGQESIGKLKQTEDSMLPPTPPPGSSLVIAFQSARDGDREVYIMLPDGTNQTRLTFNPAFDAEPWIAPDGNHIIFQSDRTGSSQIYSMNADGSSPVNLTNNLNSNLETAMPSDGSKIAFCSFDPDAEIYVMNPDGSNQVNLTNNTTITDTDPFFSPDGTKIAFRSNRDGNEEIYVMSVDGSNPTRLTDTLALEELPAFSPDGGKIVFVSARDGNSEIYVMNADGSNQVRLTNNTATERHPTFSPDGSQIAFVSDRDGNNEIYLMNADGSNPVRLTNNTASDFGPVWGYLVLSPPVTPTPTPTPTATPTPTPTPQQVSQITSAAATCLDFAAGTAVSVASADYFARPRTASINTVDPNVVFYWLKVNAPAGANSLTINQTIATGNFNMLWAAGSGSNVFDSNCLNVKSATTQSPTTGSSGLINVNWNAPSAGVYFIGIKLDAKSFKGLPLPTPETVHYDFSTVGLPGSTSGLDLVRRGAFALIPIQKLLWPHNPPTNFFFEALGPYETASTLRTG